MFEWAKEYDNHIEGVATALSYGKSEEAAVIDLHQRGLSHNGIRLVMWAAKRLCASMPAPVVSEEEWAKACAQTK